MLTKAWKKIDRFYFILAIVMIILVIPFIYTVSGIFSAFVTAYEVDSSVGKSVRINKSDLDSVLSSVYDKDVKELIIREKDLPVVNEEQNVEKTEQ